MGIFGLLPSIKSIQKQWNIKELKGKTIAIDSYCWLHKASYSIGLPLLKYRGLDRMVSYWVKRIEMMKNLDITPIFVFDGAQLPMKKGVEVSRSKSIPLSDSTILLWSLMNIH